MAKNEVLFVTSSAPLAGKTTVAAGLIRQLVRLGRRPVGIKPIELGAGYDEHHDLLGPDGDVLAQASPVPVPPLVRSPYRFTHRTAPLVAADLSGLSLELDDLASTIRTAAEYGTPVVVEGPGAAWSAVAQNAIGLDLAEKVGATMVVVVPERAGEEASALSTLEGCRRRGLKIAGLCTTHREHGFSEAELACLLAFAGVQFLGRVPLLEGPEAVDAVLTSAGARVADALGWP